MGRSGAWRLAIWRWSKGFKAAPIPKLEIYRESVGKPLLHPGDPHIPGSRERGPARYALPVFAIDDVDAIAAFIRAHSRPFQAPRR